MPARLSSLLVRDGLVGVKRMEKAFQRQVIYGGSLDTILLEMSLVPEERLTQYLALASGLPPAAKDEGDHIAETALPLINAEIAAQFRALPLSLDGEALRILVCSPLQMSELEDLADLLDRPLQPLITPEYRWHLTYAHTYRVDPPARFTTLARSLSVETAPAPVGRAKSVIIEDHSGPAVRVEGADEQTAPMLSAPLTTPAPVAAEGDTTERVELPLAAIATLPERSRTATILGVQPVRPAVPEVVGIGIPPRLPAVPQSKPQIPVPPVEDATPVPVAVTQAAHTATPSTGIPRPLDTTHAVAGPRAAIQRAAIEPIATAGRDSPLAVVRARELLATADDRDTVFLTLLRAARARARYAGLLTVQGGAAIGRLALAEAGIDTKQVTTVLIPLDAHSPFRSVVQNKKPHIGSLVSKDPSIDSMLLRLGGSLPASALLMPIILRDRVIAIVVAHRVHSDLKLVDVTELLPLASGAADALGRLIVKHKSAGYRAPVTAAPSVEITDDTIDTKKLVRKDGGEWAVAQPAAVPHIPIVTETSSTSSPAITPPPRRPVAELLTAIETAPEGRADAYINEAVERATEILPELLKRFPGKLHVDRFSVAGRPLRAAQYGGLLELTVKLGAAAAELLIEELGSPQRDTRFYAAVCAAELRPRNAVFALVEHVFDQDFGVRTMAIEALAGYPPAHLAEALPRARRALHASDPETVGAAAHVLVTLGDVDAIDDLMSELDRGDRGGEHVRRALASLTAQDFGLSERKWRKWYEGAKRRHRIEWLIEGLSHKVDGIREAAINDLRRLTGEYFGYHHDLPRKEREVAAERWSSWWRETGQRRFVHREDERHRPTGVLPTRRD